MKKYLSLIIVMLFVFSGCGQKPDSDAEPEAGTDTVENGSELNATGLPLFDEPVITEEDAPGEYAGVFLSKYVDKGVYFIKYRTEDGAVYELAATGEKMAVKDDTGTKIVDGETLYYVLHEQKAIITSPKADAMKEGFTDILGVKTEAEAQKRLVTSGTEEIDGAEYVFEEYSGDSDNTVKVYFDSQTIRYIRTISAEGNETLTKILAVSKTVPEGFFDVPDGYIIQDISKMSDQ